MLKLVEHEKKFFYYIQSNEMQENMYFKNIMHILKKLYFTAVKI